ncbi:antibiotic biosynthesis monooxygenase family protein [Arthrobacter sp. NIO-1057]|uniref:antibiotic biosynthesis monooxygenase family protein n=1 Tax=Arthrobacter sp. NIO-1057 TaxID=993071 RepID=UPI00071C453A|nr:antibiotic biosynthesis monooxygenase [Arthrobacter sp. NIO-1057]KSU66050.1 monooxygenase [Arthrobacter sp. NIO-1057]SCC30892.1 Antibiotic biosynthesis monooxygenase [Arthrobacter sp. NIO-1057]
MSIVVINALSVPAEAGEELEKRFAARKHSVDSSPGFEGFKLLRPVNGGDRYFVYTQWATREDFENWRDQRAGVDHAGGDAQKPVAQGADLMEFEIVEL